MPRVLDLRGPMPDTTIALNRLARIQEVKHAPVDESAKLRLYGASPESAVLQIRVHGPITESRAGTPRPMVATAYLDAAQLRELRDLIDDEISRLEAAP